MSDLETLIFNCRHYSDYDAAALLHALYSKHSPQTNTFKDLSLFLSTHVYNAVMAHCRDLSHRALEARDSNEQEKYTVYVSELFKFANVLKNKRSHY